VVFLPSPRPRRGFGYRSSAGTVRSFLMKPIRILIADDHSIVRRGLRSLLESKPEYRVCGEASTGAEAILKAKRLKPDVVVMDISMPEVNGLEATRQIRRELQNTAVLILTMHASEQLMREVLNAGARGYVLKTDFDRNLILAIDALHQGKTYFSAKVSEIMLEDYIKRSADPPEATKPTKGSLTARQTEVVRLLAEGKTNKEVASALGISVKTAETHRTNIMGRLELHSFSDLVRYAVKEKIVEP